MNYISCSDRYFPKYMTKDLGLSTWTVLSVVRTTVPEVSAGPVTVAGFGHLVLDNTFARPGRIKTSSTCPLVRTDLCGQQRSMVLQRLGGAVGDIAVLVIKTVTTNMTVHLICERAGRPSQHSKQWNTLRPGQPTTGGNNQAILSLGKCEILYLSWWGDGGLYDMSVCVVISNGFDFLHTRSSVLYPLPSFTDNAHSLYFFSERK